MCRWQWCYSIRRGTPVHVPERVLQLVAGAMQKRVPLPSIDDVYLRVAIPVAPGQDVFDVGRGAVPLLELTQFVLVRFLLLWCVLWR